LILKEDEPCWIPRRIGRFRARRKYIDRGSKTFAWKVAHVKNRGLTVFFLCQNRFFTFLFVPYSLDRVTLPDTGGCGREGGEGFFTVFLHRGAGPPTLGSGCRSNMAHTKQSRPDSGLGWCPFEREGNSIERLQYSYESQGQNLALTVLFVLNSYDSCRAITVPCVRSSSYTSILGDIRLWVGVP
jgi:hypothetical protein